MYNILRVRQTCWEAKSYIQQGSSASLPLLLQNATLDHFKAAYAAISDAATKHHPVKNKDLPWSGCYCRPR
jgi:hypothetical protein